MNAKAIETLAVDAVKESIIICDYLDQYIAENDKEPSWDGHIYVYSSPRKTKKDDVQRIPVQVKGTQQLDLHSNTIKYRVYTDDLKAYLRDGGVLFFVVCISKDAKEKEIFYLPLTPVKIRMTLGKLTAQKSTLLSFSKFPTDNDWKARICFNFLEECKKQASFTDAHLYTPETIIGKKELEGFELSFIHVGDRQTFEEALLNSTPHLYARIKGSSIPHPLLVEPHKVFVSNKVNGSVVVNNEEYYSCYEKYKSATETTILIGKSVRITYANSTEENIIGSVTTKLTPMLSERVKDLRFIVAMVENKIVTIDGHTFLFDYSKNGEELEQKGKDTLEFFERMEALMKRLRVDHDIDLSKFTEEDFALINSLTSLLLDTEKGNTEEISKGCKTHQKIGDMDFLFWVDSDWTKGRKFRISDFFDCDARITILPSGEPEYTMSHYALLTLDDILYSTNFSFDHVIESFEKYCVDTRAYILANNVLLLLLKAVDKADKRREEYLRCALILAEWLRKTPEETISPRTVEINRLQVIKRMRKLQETENQFLWDIVENHPEDVCSQILSYFLLDLSPMAERLISQLNEESQQLVKESPIYYFAGKRDE